MPTHLPWEAGVDHISELRDLWPTLWDSNRAVAEAYVPFREAFAYVDAFPLDRQSRQLTTPEERAQIEATPTPLCRLSYLGVPIGTSLPYSGAATRSRVDGWLPGTMAPSVQTRPGYTGCAQRPPGAIGAYSMRVWLCSCMYCCT